jgi:hypothetical protein
VAPEFLDPHAVLRWSAGLAAGVAALTCVEVLASLRDYDKGGVFDCALNPFSHRLKRWLRPSVGLVRALALIRLALAAVLWLPGPSPLVLSLSAAGVVMLGVLQSRLASGDTEFGEQMVKVILGGAALGWIGGSEVTVRWAVWFIAAQLSLAYFAAGVFKLISSSWRSGEALSAVLSMNPWKHAAAGRSLRQRPQWSSLLSWGTMLWEVTFPLALIAPPWAMAIWLAIGLAFHIGCAIFMGLNSYLWSFVAAYPAVAFLNSSLRGFTIR